MRGASLRDCARHHGRHGNPIADATATCRRRGQNRTSYQTPSQRCPGPRNSRHGGDFHRHNRRTRRGARRSCIPRSEWSNETYIFGYPPISTLDTPYLLVQRGAVVNPAVKSQQDEHFFLYSAIARPGNSGGPIVAQDGRVGSSPMTCPTATSRQQFDHRRFSHARVQLDMYWTFHLRIGHRV